MYKAVMILVITIASFCAKAQEYCNFYASYAEMFYLEKNQGNLSREEAFIAVLHAATSVDEYLNLDEYEQQALEMIIRDIGNQVYADDSKSIEAVVAKAVAYCKHIGNEVKKTQSRRIKYCQSKGENAEYIAELARNGIEKESLVKQIKQQSFNINATVENGNLLLVIDKVYQRLEKGAPINPQEIGANTYNECVLSRG